MSEEGRQHARQPGDRVVARDRARSRAAPRGGHGRRGRSGAAPRTAAGLARRAQARRSVVVPPITYPAELPVSARREDIAAAIRDHQVVIVAGETGSGKTTQIPKIALELGRGREGQIGHTQPRRIAARTVAERIAAELGTELGGVVGYQVRFTDTSSDSTLVKVMTDGVLLAQIQRDPLLRTYDTLIIDEAHERSLNIDFILGYLARLLPQRPDLRLIITSATIDSERFAAHFAGPDGTPAPVVEVTGRTYPVEIRYREPGPDTDQPTAICAAVDELLAEGPGDVLVFLSGEREIRDAAEALTAHLGARVRDPQHPQRVEILPLYARLSAAEQHRVFAPHGHRRIVLATNVAETSLTVPGIRYVVDPGTARISRYSKATKVQRLPIEPISRASADQRAGRCGRVAEGVCIRLYSEEDFAARPEFTEPEILRTSLAAVILQMLAVGVVSTPDEVARFPFVERPDVRAVRDGVQLLHELGAIETVPDDAGGHRSVLTGTGRALARLPVDPRLARMIVEADRRGVAGEVMVVAAALTIQDPRERPTEQRPQADQAHARFADRSSDFLAYLNLWAYLTDRQQALSGNAFRRLCRSEFLSYLRVREWQDLVAQLRQMGREVGIRAEIPGAGGARGETAFETVRRGPSGAAAHRAEVTDGEAGGLARSWDADAIHQSLLAGLLSQIGMQQVTEVRVGARPGHDRRSGRESRHRPRNEYLGARGARFAIFPGSALAKRPPAWIMAAELVETSRLWARDVARIRPEWIEDLAGHLVRRTYSEPHWSTRLAAAMAYEKVLLHGVPIVARRRVPYARVDPGHAREMFIRHALVQGEWTTHHRFFHENRELLARAEEVEHRLRRRGLVVDDEVLFDFYDARIPPEVVSARHFDTWWKAARRERPDLLTFDPEMLLDEAAGSTAELTTGFPDTWRQDDLQLPLTYQFEPGSEADGVTVHIPITVLGRVQPDGFDWLVPGLREELVTALIRSLPKALRTQLVPAPDTARAVVDWLAAHDVAGLALTEAVGDAVWDLRGVDVPDDAWDRSRLPAHLRMTFRVTDERGMGIAEGEDLTELQRRLATRAQDAVRRAVRSAVRHAAATTTTGEVGTAAPAALTRAGLTAWPEDLREIPEVVETTTAEGVVVRGYPALVDETDGVALQVLADPAVRGVEHPQGVRRLLALDVGLPVGRVTSRWTGSEALTLAAGPYRSTEALVADAQLAAVGRLLTPEEAAAVRDSESYRQVRERVRAGLEDAVHGVVGEVVAALGAARQLEATIRQHTSQALLPTLTDVRAQLSRLVHDGFITAAAENLPHLARYLCAAQVRIEKAADNPQRDTHLAWQVGELEDEVARWAEGPPSSGRGPDRDRVAAVRWMLEELRVSLFAQQLGTAHPISAKRIRAAMRD